MAKITNYGTLKTEIASWINRKNLANEIPGFIQMAEDRIGNDVRVPDMIVRTTGTFNTSFLPLDEDRFIELISLKTECGGFQITKDTFGNFGIHVLPDPTGSQYELMYYQKYPIFSADSDTNWLLDNHVRLYLAASLIAANDYLKDEAESAKWQRAYLEKLEELARFQNRAEFPPGSLVVQVA